MSKPWLGYTRGPLHSSLAGPCGSWSGCSAYVRWLKYSRVAAVNTGVWQRRSQGVARVAKATPNPYNNFLCLSCLFSHVKIALVLIFFFSSQQQAAKLSCSVPYFIGEYIDKQWKKLEVGRRHCCLFWVFHWPDQYNQRGISTMVQKVEEMPMEKRPKWAVAALDHIQTLLFFWNLTALKCTIIFILQLITWRHVTAFAGFYLKMDEWTKRWNRLLSTPPKKKLFGFARIVCRSSWSPLGVRTPGLPAQRPLKQP